MRFFCINDGVPLETVRTLREACQERNVELVEVHAPGFKHGVDPGPAAGDLMYCPAVSTAATRLEQYLFRDDVATFYRDRRAVFFECPNSPLYHQRCGLPIPKTIAAASANRAALRSHVDQLGGFPVVVKVPGGDAGVGVMPADSFAALFSILDYVRHRGSHPILSQYIADAEHWRLIVLGDLVLTAYRNVPAKDDFRTYASESPDDYGLDPGEALADIAVRSLQVLGYEFGGVDILVDPQGRPYLLEANFPCYFAHPTETAGIDVAGPMVDHLVAKAARIRERNMP